jgi:hypothetical protein
MNELDEFWISTQYRQKVHFAELNHDEIDPLDIATALSNQCRFGGHVKHFYSVAEHCVHVLHEVQQQTLDIRTWRAALLHDASEAYLIDIPRPIKAYLTSYKHVQPDLLYYDLDKEITQVLNEKFDIVAADWTLIKDIDARICITEAQQLNVWHDGWEYRGDTYPIKIHCWTPSKAFDEFLIDMKVVGGLI